MIKRLLICTLMLTMAASVAIAQNNYRYAIDLTKVNDDQIRVELTPPKITAQEITFYLPRIIPGTYNNADYGKFVHDLKAWDKQGKELPVKKTSDNSWQIKSANKLSKLTYSVEDTWESSIAHDVYDMAGTNIEAGKNFVINTPGFFGYFAGMKEMPFELTFTKPESFYGSTPLVPAKSTNNQDVYVLEDADHLYDSPIMYSIPDTTSITLGRTQVQISVYSPKKLVTSKDVAGLLKEMLTATQNYLGGRLPVDKYAFIYYFNGEQAPLQRTGALEHNYSSFYALPEIPFQNIAPTLLDISAHEFFHVVTPLTISSREVKEFNFNEPVLSKHLWLYEGTTEYQSDHVQVSEGLATPEEFLQKLTQKITTSRSQYNDELAFTELSKQSADKHKDQYGNVYEKGALIAACLDVYLLKLSGGEYGLRELKHDLGIKFGKDKYFNDDELFDEIAKLTYPEVRKFFATYVEGPTPIPYDNFFSMAGVNLVNTPTPSLGNIQLGATQDGLLFIAGNSNMNPMGKQLGYEVGDEIISINGKSVTIQNAQEVIDKYKADAKEGEQIQVVVKRKDQSGEKKEVTLTGNVFMTRVIALDINPKPTPEQLIVRNAWFGSANKEAAATPAPEANPADVSDENAIVNAMYNVISGPAGKRNWDRFRSLFYPGAYMGAVVKTPAGTSFRKFTPEEYMKMNDPLFMQFDFNEKELNRKVNTFGNVAQVFSTYEYKVQMPQQTIQQRGINSISLIKENGRWWIMNLMWDEERPEQSIPAQYLPAPQEAPVKKKKK